MDGPALRVSYNRIALQLADRMPKGAAIRSELSDETVHAIEDGFRFAWLPMDHHMALIEAGRRHLGDREAYEWHRRTTLESFSASAFQIPIEAIRRLFGLTPVALASQSARHWPHYARELGTLRLSQHGDDYATLALDGFPAQYLASGTYAIGMAGGLAAYFDLCKVQGKVVPRVLDEAKGRVDFDFRWRPR